MYRWFAYRYVYTPCVYTPGACGGREKVPEVLELESQMIVGHHMGDGDQTHVLWKSSQCF